MASLLRSVARQGRVLQIVSKNKFLRVRAVPLFQHEACISTSEKKKDVGSTVQPMEKSAELKRLTEIFKDSNPNKEENYVTYGLDSVNRDNDWFYHHLTMFLCISVGICGGIFIIAYQPDYKFMDWAQREAFLELERRQKEGLPLVDPDYIKADSIVLPSDEELGDTEIII
ncbi:NADH dehydrogenase [ubiquinone] 1 beta subcomplex subunit 11, mitochondrial-like [Physella acuta]|uniref:NADH dehydrogenase [ubiquinone] 1 beta subcomplex subunit 11, mitochondrial-like n=1 Tax=Physella acuta TaxID=109671 RepID=UPI0027DBC941|nr:NADH dehydrogenase [ubiquinone] 1 beta subcomplex subunit 11, mitochondrial-like [Physella acuta]